MSYTSFLSAYFHSIKVLILILNEKKLLKDKIGDSESRINILYLKDYALWNTLSQ